jgi:hypothetical protein
MPSRTTLACALSLLLFNAAACTSGSETSSESESAGSTSVSDDCGDGLLDPGEECDEGGADEDRCAADCTKQARVVFLSSTLHSGALGGLTAADAICQQLADAAELPGVFLAWLSDDTGAPVTRFIESTVPYVLVNTKTEETWFVADNSEELFSGALQRRILIDETGEAAFIPTDTWTNTRPDGTAVGENTSCMNWTAMSGSGVVGDADQLTATWTQNTSTSCSQLFHLYCVEQ